MTAVFKEELKEALKEESYFNKWDNQSLKEVEELIRTYWNSSNTDIEEYVAWDMMLKSHDKKYRKLIKKQDKKKIKAKEKNK